MPPKKDVPKEPEKVTVVRDAQAAIFVHIEAGLSKEPCSIMINGNCRLDIALDYIKREMIKKFNDRINEMKNQLAAAKESPDNEVIVNSLTDDIENINNFLATLVALNNINSLELVDKVTSQPINGAASFSKLVSESVSYYATYYLGHIDLESKQLSVLLK